MKLWKSPALYFGILLILLVSGAIVAPHVMDWGQYRADIENFGGQLTGRTVTIEGPISVRLFPWPKLAIEDVKIANPKEASEPDLLAAKRVEVRMTLAGLFSGQIRVETIDVIEPVISFERLATGRGSWDIEPAPGVLADRLLDRVKLDQITLTGGTVNLIDRSRHGRATLDKVDAVISAPGIAGPWRARGHADYKAKPIEIAVNTGEWRTDKPFKFGLRVAPADGSGLVYSFDGANDGAQIKGGLQIEPAIRADGRSDAEGEFRPLMLTARLTADFDTVALDKIEIAPRDAAQTGTNLLSGSARLSLGSAIKLTADLSATRFDLDAVAGAKARAILRTGGGLALLDGLAKAVPDQVEVDCSLKVTSLIAGGATLDGVKLAVDIGDDAIQIRELSASMPGQARGLFRGMFIITEAGPQLLGDLSGEASSLRDFVEWAWPEGRDDIGRIWTGSRGRLKIETKIDVGSDRLRFEDAAFQIEDSLGKGSFAYSSRGRPAVDLRLSSDSLDLDALVPNGIAAFAPSGGGWANIAARFAELSKDRDFRLALETGELRLNGVAANNVAVDIAAGSTGLDIKTVKIGRVGDARLEVSGLLASGAMSPSGSLSAGVTAQDPRGLLQLLGFLPPGVRPKWTEALGATDLRVNAELKPDEKGGVATLEVQGESGLLAIDGTISAAAAADWLASEVSGSVVVSSAGGVGLLRLLGREPVVAQDGPAKLALTATGSLKAGLLADLEADLFGAHAQYQGSLTLGPDGLHSHGRGGLFAGRSQALLAALGVAAADDVISLESDIDIAPSKITLPGIKGVLGGAPVSGTLAIDSGSHVNGEFTTGPVRLTQLLTLVFMPWTGGAADLEGPFSTRFPGDLTGEVWIKPRALDLFEGLAISESQIGISADAGQIRLAAAGKNGNGEDVRLEFGSRAEGDARAVDARITVPLDLSVALRTRDGNPIAAGPITLSARVEGSGRSPAAAFANLRGSGTYQYSDARLRRIDAAQFADVTSKAKSAEDVTTALSALLSGGDMPLGDGKGIITIDGGTAAFYPIAVKSPTADVILTPLADLANGSLDLSARVQLKTSENLPAMGISYIGVPGALNEIVDANALQSYLGMKVLEHGLDELERLQKEQQRVYEEEQRTRKEDEARLETYYAQRREMELRIRELKVHRTNEEIQAQRAKAEAEQAYKDAKAMTRAEMSTKMREVRARRRIAAARQASEKVQESNKPASGEAVRVPLPRAKSAEPNATAANDPFQPLVLVPPAKPAAEPQGFDLFDIFGSASSTKKWLKQREQTR